MIDADLKELYQEIILDHGRHPRNHKKLDSASHHAHGHNPLCGDTVDVELDLDKEGRVRKVAFTGKGCAISVASASLMTEILIGKSEDEVRRLVEGMQHLMKGETADRVDEDDLERMMPLSGVAGFPMRVKCATLAWHTARAALDHAGSAKTE